MDWEFLANVAQVLSLPISIIALFFGGKAMHTVNKNTKNYEVNRNKFVGNRIKNNARATKRSNITNVYNNGLGYGDVNGIVDGKLTEVRPAINTVEELRKILAKNSKYSIPVIWSGSQIEYDAMKKNGEITPEVLYCITED